MFLTPISPDRPRAFGPGLLEAIWILCFGIKVGRVDHNHLWLIEYGVRWRKGKLSRVVPNTMEAKVAAAYRGELLGANLQPGNYV